MMDLVCLVQIVVVLLNVFETLKKQRRLRCGSDQGCQKFWNIVIGMYGTLLIGIKTYITLHSICFTTKSNGAWVYS